MRKKYWLNPLLALLASLLMCIILVLSHDQPFVWQSEWKSISKNHWQQSLHNIQHPGCNKSND